MFAGEVIPVPTLVAKPVDTTALVGEKTTLECLANGAVSISWTREGMCSNTAKHNVLHQPVERAIKESLATKRINAYRRMQQHDSYFYYKYTIIGMGSACEEI